MRGRKRERRSLSVGTVVMLTLTALVLIGFCALLPKLAGNVDIKLNASELAVAIDQSIAQLTSSAAQTRPPKEAPTPSLAPDTFTTVAPVTQAPKLSFSLRASGRINMNTAIQKSLTDDTGYQFDQLLSQLGSILNADLSVATLADNVVSTAKLSDTNIPVEALTALKEAGIDALCVGYPNALDEGVGGVALTKQNIAGAGLIAYGVYTSAAERSTAVIADASGIKIGLLSFQNELSSNGKKRADQDDRAIALAGLELATVQQEIEKVKQAGAQIVLVSLCWGKSGATSATDDQRELAQGIADAGADIILGTNPEAVQEVEILTANRGDNKYHPVLCAYSMGNLITHNRDKRGYLAGLVLGAQVEYDAASDTVAFDDLSYTPVYNWRGKIEGKTSYRVLISNQTAADFVDKDQSSVMSRCLKLIRELMDGSLFVER